MLRATVWGLTLLLAQVWHAQAQIPRLTPSSEAYAFAVLDEPLGWEDLLSMAQWASSTGDAVQSMDPSLALDAIRITSYNVCYTKLLRHGFIQGNIDQGLVAHGDFLWHKTSIRKNKNISGGCSNGVFTINIRS